MKRLFTIFMLLAGLTAHARTGDGLSRDFSIGIGGYPLLEDLIYGTHGDVYFPTDISLNSVYSEKTGNLWSSGTVVMQYGLPLKKWLYIPLSLSFNVLGQGYTDLVDGSRRTETNIVTQFMPGIQFRYMNHKKINFYSGFSLGIGLATDSWISLENIGGTTVEKKVNRPELIGGFQITPIGVRIGGKVYGKAEIGAGCLYVGGLLGIGIRL